jgi:hypothetical protein
VTLAPPNEGAGLLGIGVAGIALDDQFHDATA